MHIRGVSDVEEYSGCFRPMFLERNLQAVYEFELVTADFHEW